MPSTLVRVGYLPPCPHCKDFIHDILFHYRTEDDVYFYFLPVRAAPRYEEFRADALSYIYHLAVMHSSTDLVSVVPHTYVNGSLIIPKSGVPSKTPLYNYHPSTLSPFIRRIKRRPAYDFSPIDRDFYEEYKRFVSTILGKKIEERTTTR